MLSLDDAWAYVRERLPVLDVVEVALSDALGCALAERVVADAAVPPFASSAVDGYAVRRADVDGAPDRGVGLVLEVVAEVAAGQVGERSVGRLEAVRIMTGAPVPPGADAVVMVEDTEVLDDGRRVRVTRAAAAGAHCRPAGDDLTPGTVVAEPGTLVTPAQVGLLATVGRRTVRVVRRPVVGVLSTGDELVDAGAPAGPGQIVDSNRPQLLAACRAAGVDVVDLGRAADVDEAVEALLLDGVGRCDALLSSGGVSMGDHDRVKVVLGQLGDLRWMQVAVKPAKPFAFGLLPGGARPVPVFGLPGNPVSSLVSFELFARPGLRVMAGRPDEQRRTVAGRAPEGLGRRPDGKTHFVRVRTTRAPDGVLDAVPHHRQGSHQLTGLAAADAFAVLPDGDGVAPGGPVELLLLD